MILIFPCLFFLEWLYLKIARYFNIVDKPTERGMHSNHTIRGGGVIYSLAGFLFFLFHDFLYPSFFLGLLLLAIVSFIDDLISISSKVRLLAQGIACLLLFYEWSFYGGVVWPLLLIVSVGILNAYNFMDGINGITGAYSFVILVFLGYLNFTKHFVDQYLITYLTLSVIVFLWFNFRKKALCFGGDVGSIVMAFSVLFLLGKLILFTDNYIYLLFLFVYGLDTIYTILYRLRLRQNVLKPHKLHFFQMLVYKYKWTHLQVSLIYSFIQIVLNFWIMTVSALSVTFYLPFVFIIAMLHFFRKKMNMALS